jgi:hypothetical protein
MTLTDSMKKWAVDFAKHMDVFEKSIVEIGEGKDSMHVKYKKKDLTFFIRPELDSNFSDVIKAAEKDGFFASVVTLNTSANIDRLIKNWAIISAQPRLKVYFINPYSQLERKWVLCPYTHSKISDDDALKAGLMSLFSTVDPVTPDQIKRMEKEGF